MARNILLIGGNSGIGLSTAKRLQAKGDTLTVASRSHDQLTQLGIPVQPFDATDASLALALPDALDGVVYCPGTINFKPFTNLNEADFLADFQVNLLVKVGMPYHASIAASKGAVEGLTRSLAAEWAPKVRVNAIAPALTDTPLVSSLLSDEKRRSAAAERSPLKQIGEPDHFAELTDHLLSDAARYTTGQIFRPDGGLSSVRLF